MDIKKEMNEDLLEWYKALIENQCYHSNIIEREKLKYSLTELEDEILLRMAK